MVSPRPPSKKAIGGYWTFCHFAKIFADKGLLIPVVSGYSCVSELVSSVSCYSSSWTEESSRTS